MYDDLLHFCWRAEKEKRPASENMSITNWERKPNTLLHCLYKEGRFDSSNGLFTLLYDSNTNRIVSVSGAYRYYERVVIGGVRAWNDKQIRKQYLPGNTIIPVQYEWAQKNNADYFVFTYNDYNYDLFRMMTRSGKYAGKAENGALGGGRPELYKKLIPHETPIVVQGVPQWIAYIQLRDTAITIDQALRSS
jgi:hypothetical protein